MQAQLATDQSRGKHSSIPGVIPGVRSSIIAPRIEGRESRDHHRLGVGGRSNRRPGFFRLGFAVLSTGARFEALNHDYGLLPPPAMATVLLIQTGFAMQGEKRRAILPFR